MITSLDNLGVVTNNSAAVVHLGVGLLALSGEGLLALLNVGGVHNGLAYGPRHLTLVLLWDLVTLSVLLLVTLRATGVSSIAGLSIRLGLSLSLAVSVTMGDNLGVVTNNSGALVNLLGYRVAVFSDDVRALLDVGGVNNHVILLVTLLPLVLDGLLMTLLVWLAEALLVVVLVVSRFSFSLSFTLVVSNMSLSHYLGVMSNNSRAVVNLLRCLLAVLSDNILTLLHISSVHHHVILLVTSLVIVSLASSV